MNLVPAWAFQMRGRYLTRRGLAWYEPLLDSMDNYDLQRSENASSGIGRVLMSTRLQRSVTQSSQPE